MTRKPEQNYREAQENVIIYKKDEDCGKRRQKHLEKLKRNMANSEKEDKNDRWKNLIKKKDDKLNHRSDTTRDSKINTFYKNKLKGQ